MARQPGHLEVHEHCFISGPNSCYARTDRSRVVHSHEGGDVPHKHADTGPASYTIDKDEWFRATGLRGGGRKKFTAKPSGPQFENSTGPGVALPLRMIKTFGMTVSSIREG